MPKKRTDNKSGQGVILTPDHNEPEKARVGRLFCFTSFNMEDPPSWDVMKQQGATYLCYGREVCPSTKREHWQGFVRFSRTMNFKTGLAAITQGCAGSLQGRAKAPHVEMCKGSILSNVKYTSKEGSWSEHGQLPAQGARNDLKDLAATIAQGAVTVDELCIENPEAVHMYGRTLDRVEDISRRKNYRTTMTTGIWYHGPTGVGKSHQAFEGFTPETHYVYPDDNGWWDGYCGQETVVLNDFRGEIPYNQMLKMIDKWPYSVRRRGREPMPFTSSRVIITSSLSPDEVFWRRDEKDSLAQLMRRIQVVNLT